MIMDLKYGILSLLLSTLINYC